MRSLFVLAAVLASTVASAAPLPDPALLDRARSILERVPLIDGHNDLPHQYRRRVENRMSELDIAHDLTGLDPRLHTDIARLKAGGLGAQFWSVYVPADLEEPAAVVQTIEQIDVVHRLNARYPETFELALTADDIRRIHGEGKIASLIGVEGGHSIAGSLGVLRQLYRLGARYMTLTHSANTAWADSSTDDPEHDGLTPFGLEVVREMNRLGMLVDLSHVAETTMHDALDVTASPVIFSHSSARAINAHPRNVPDAVLRRLPDNGGVVMVTFVPSFVSEEARQASAERAAAEERFESLFPGDPDRAKAELDAWREANPSPRATYLQVADHIDHIRRIAGIDHIGIGSDFDGIGSTPAGLSDVADFPVLFAELLRRGYSESDLEKIAGLNVLRVMDRVEDVAARLSGERRPSEVLIDDFLTEPDSAWIEGPAGRIRVSDGGFGEAVPVVFVHGNGSDHRVWDEQLEHLRASRRAIAYDLRGMGQSERPEDGDYSIPAMVADLEAVVDTLGLRTFVLVGHSYGGGVVAAYAGRHPHRVAGLVFADAAGDLSIVPPEQSERFRRLLEPETYERAVISYFRQILEGARPDTEREVLASVRDTPRTVFVGAGDAMRGMNLVAPLRRYDGPMLAIMAEGFAENPLAVNQALPELPVRVMSGVSHWLMMDDPATFNAHLDEFLASLER